jgi:hypothetical protein
MSVTMQNTKPLFEAFIKNYDSVKSQEIWKKQSQQFRDFWQARIMPDDGTLSEEDIQPIIRILDCNAKGVRNSGVEPACRPFGITQNKWYRLFREIKGDNKLKDLVNKIFKSDSDTEKIQLIDEIYESYHNALTHKTANILNDLLFAYNPNKELSIVSLKHRLLIINAFGLGDSGKLEKLSHGNQIVHSRKLILDIRDKFGLNLDNRGLSKAFYHSEPINELWFHKEDKKRAPKKRGRKPVRKDIKELIGDDDLSFELEDDDEPVELDIKDRRVFSDKRDWSIFELSHQSKRGRLKLNPEFQRYYIWDDNTASRLIESVFLEIPIPVIYLAEDQDSRYSVIDGQQRLRSLFRFLDNDLELRGLQVCKELNGKKYHDIGSKSQNKFENYNIRVIEIGKDSHSAVKFEIFERLNRGSFKLNDQELRNCIYRGRYNSLLKDLSEDKDFMFLLGLKKPHKRMFDRELVLRFLSFHNSTYLKYTSPMKRFFNIDMEQHRDLTDKQESDLSDSFKKSVQLTKTVFGSNAFKRFMPGTEKDQNGLWEKRRINQALFDIIMFGFTQYDKNQVVPLADAVREELIWLMTHDQEFIGSILISTSSRDKVYTRFEKWIHSLKEVLGAPKTEGRNFSVSLKEQLFTANPTCAICGQTIHTVDDAEVDHIEFYWRGGKTIPSNARLVHRYCNRARGGRD